MTRTESVEIGSQLYKHIMRIIEKHGDKAKLSFDGIPYRIIDAKPSDRKGCINFYLRPY